MTPALRKKRIWGASDLATFLGWHFLKARRFLLRLNKKHGGKLLLPRGGENRPHTFYLATLAKLEPDMFAPIESVEFRLDELEERAGQHDADVRRVAMQTGANTRDIAKHARALSEHARTVDANARKVEQLRLRLGAA